MRVLITGAGGQLGLDLVDHCVALGDEVVAMTRAELDVGDAAQVSAAVQEHRPEVVVNSAAWTAVDLCEGDPDRADLVNGHAVGYLARACEAVGAHLVHVSTDYVFDGTKAGPYQVTDEPNPQSVYGRSKLLGEQRAGPDATVVRTSWVFSRHGGNMVETVLRLAGEYDTLRFVDDQRGNPTHTADLAIALRHLAAGRHPGLFHVTNGPAVSWYEFALAVLDVAGDQTTKVEPIPTSEMQRPAARPANSVLSNAAYLALGFAPLPDFRQALEAVI